MSEMLSIEWEHSYVSGVVADVSPGRVVIRRTFIIPRPTVSGSASGTLQLDWLKPELAKQGIAAGPALVALPRDEVVVKRLDLPEVADDELPVLVRFQAGAKSSVGIDDLSLDFIPLPRQSGIPGREVTVATIPRQSLDEVTTVCQAAAIETKVIGLSAVAMAQFIVRAERHLSASTGGVSLVVGRHGSRVEVSVMRQGHLLFSHANRLFEGASNQEAQAITSEVSRALVALRGSLTADVKIERIWTMVSPAEQELLAESLHRRLNCEVHPLDPFESVECEARVLSQVADRSLFAGPIGMLLAQYDSQAPTIDFLSPRRPPVKRNEARRKLIFAGAGAAALLVTLGVLQWKRVANLDEEIAELNKKENTLIEDLKLIKPTRDAVAEIVKWNGTTVEWIDEIAELTKRFPTTEKIYLDSIDCKGALNSKLAEIEIHGYARERDDILALAPKFIGDEHFEGGILTEEGAAEKEVQYYTSKFKKVLSPKPAPKKKVGAAETTSGGAGVSKDAKTTGSAASNQSAGEKTAS